MTSLSKVIHTFEDGCVLKCFSGAEIEPFIPQIGALRIGMFREFPYLYEGNLESEIAYLQHLTSQQAETLLLFKDNAIVGFMNAMPLANAEEAVQKPFIEAGHTLSDYCYVGELMVLPAYRTAQLINTCCAHYEQYARTHKYTFAIFITIDRPDNHPAKPSGYRPLEPLWRRLGFELIPDMKIESDWQQVDTQKREQNTLSLWRKRIRA